MAHECWTRFFVILVLVLESVVAERVVVRIEGIDVDVGRCFQEQLQIWRPVLRIHRQEGQQVHLNVGYAVRT